MHPPKSREALIALIEAGQSFKYIFFWGHTPQGDQQSGSWLLSQWSYSPFTVEGVTYHTAEHWMMAEKARLFDDQEILGMILASKSPGEAKDLGRRVRNFDVDTWMEKRLEIVVQGNLHKFKQRPEALTYLLNTNSRILVEASPVDPIWGIGMAKDHPNAMNPAAWRGENLLGFALMEVRALLS